MAVPAHFPLPPEKLATVLLGIVVLVCKASMLAAMIAVFLLFQCAQERQQQEISVKFRQVFNITQSDGALKEYLTNKTLEYDILKNKTHWQKVELELLLKNGCHKRNKIFLKSVQNSGKIYEAYLTCCGVKCYYFITKSEDWISCRQTCHSYRLSFVTIEDHTELDFLRSHVGLGLYWIRPSLEEDARRLAEEGDVRLDNVAVFGGRTCAVLSATGISHIDCTTPYPCVCEKIMDRILPASV